MIAGRGLQGFVDQIHSPHRVPKPRKSKASSASTSDASAPPAPRAFETGTDRPGPSDSRSLDSSIKSNDAPS
jgi:hypothetical protein